MKATILFPENYTFLGATLNLGVVLPKISNKALWKLGVAPKLALNDGQKWFFIRRSKFVQLNLQNWGKKCPQMT